MGDRFLRSMVALTVVFATALGAGTSLAAPRTADFDLTTHEGRAAYLLERGIDPVTAVIQVGSRLYAGPNCPGAGFDCVDPQEAPVLQVGIPGLDGTAVLSAECSTASCTIVQNDLSDGPGDKFADCNQTTSAATLAGVICQITQEGGGNKSATVTQKVTLKKESGATIDQVARLFADVLQDSTDSNGAAANTFTNTATFDQRAALKAETKNVVGLAIEQLQDAYIYGESQQFSEDGDNTTIMNQGQNLVSGEVKNSLALEAAQKQNTRQDAGPLLSGERFCGQEDANLHACIRQFADGGTNDDPSLGRNNVTDGQDPLGPGLTQTMRTKAEAKTGLIPVTQETGFDGGGLLGDIDGDAAFFDPAGTSIEDAEGSSWWANQSKHLIQEAVSVSATQVIDDLELCCLPGFGKTYDYCRVEQDAVLDQAPGGTTSINQHALGIAKQECDAEQFADDNGEVSTNTAESGPNELLNTTQSCDDGCETNTAPTADDTSATTDENTPVTIQLSGSDPATCELQFVIDTPPSNGSLSSITNEPCTAGSSNTDTATVDYTPSAAGTDSFTYTVGDGELTSQPATVTVTVEEAEQEIPDNAVFVMDLSGSMEFLSTEGQDCDGNGSAGPEDDFNGDGQVGNSLDCAIAKLIELNSMFAAPADPTDNIGVVVFGSSAATADVGPDPGEQVLTGPDTDAQPNSVVDVEEVARSTDSGVVDLFTQKSVGTGTDHDGAISHLNALFADFPDDNNIAYLLGDGGGSVSTGEGTPLGDAADAGTVINTFAFGVPNGCDEGQTLRAIADETAGICTVVA